MSIQGLQNPFQRLQVLPTTMNWRGTWLEDDTYFRNDVVVSPINGASYILTNQTTITGAPDPSANPEFVELSPLSTGIIGITQGTGILITGPVNNPTISNDGVVTVDGDGVTINVDNTDPNKPVISSNSITLIQQGQGISVNNTNPQVPVIGNTGVRQILAGDATVNVSNPTGIVSLSANGLLSITQGPGIGVTSGQNPQISNTGIISLTPGSGIGVTPGQNPTISNEGVLTVSAADSSIVVDNTDPQNPVIRTTTPVLTRCFLVRTADLGSSGVVPPNTAAVLLCDTPPPPNIFTDYIANGAPDPTGIFMIDFSQLSLYFFASGAVVGNVFYIAFYDALNNHEYVSTTVLNTSYLVVGQGYPITATSGMVYFNVADARATGLRIVTSVRIYNNTNANMAIQGSASLINGTYYPLGLQ
jgi:hypothetical protein